MGFKFNPKKKKETTNKTIRFPKELADKIEEIVADRDSNFTYFVVQVCEQAVNDIIFEYGVKNDEEN